MAIHGMGRASPTYADRLQKALFERLDEAGPALHFAPVYYENLLSPNQSRVWKACSRTLRWTRLRRFGLFFLADAGALESRKSEPDSAYTRVQIRIAQTLYEACRTTGPNSPLVLIAHSLGCQILSNYLWDAQKYLKHGRSNVGIWTDPKQYASDITDSGTLSHDELAFMAGHTLRYLYTTGCNIPMFVAGHDQSAIEPISPPNANFKWHNFYDKDDPLGWPLSILSPSYAKLVSDHQVNASGGWLAWLLASWNPLSHGRYWQDKDVLAPLRDDVASLL